MNYFEVLGLSIDNIQGKDEVTINSIVNAAHKRLYALTVGAYSNIPRPDGKTQAQWQQILNEAKATLIDPQKRQAHIAELTGTGNRRNEFINLINTFKTTSPTITAEQYNGLLQQAQNEYGLTSDEADNILQNSGLIIRESDTQQDTPVVSDPIDEFTAFLAAVKATSPKITLAQSKGFLKRAIQNYGLTDAEAKRVLADSGLVVEKNARSVLKLSIAAVLVALLGVGGIVIYSEWMDERERIAQEQIETHRREQAALETMKARLAAERRTLLERRNQLIEKVGFKGATDLHIAAGLNLPLLTQSLLEQGIDVNASDDSGSGPLHYAALENAHQTAKMLLNNGANVNQLSSAKGGPYFDAPIDYAVMYNATETVDILLKNGAVAGDKMRSYSGTLLHTAARHNAAETISVFLNHGANVDVFDGDFTGGRTPLHEAVQHNAVESAEVLIKNGADVNNGEPNRKPLHYAAEKNDRESAELLLENGAQVNAKDYENRTPLQVAAEYNAAETAAALLNAYPATPLHFAARDNDYKTVETLLKNGANVNAKIEDGFTPLHFAVRTNAPLTVELLLKNGANVNAQTVYGGTPLHEAAVYDVYAIAEFLVQNGADINARDNFGKSPLHSAVGANACKTTEVLLNYGPNVNIKTDSNDISYGETVLHVAARNNFDTIAELLLNKGAEANTTNKYDDTPLHFAAKANAHETVEILLKYGAEVNVVNGKYTRNTPLHEAATANAHETVEILLKYGAEVNAKNEASDTPLHNAAGTNASEIIEVLLKNGADINAKNETSDTPLHNAAEAFAIETVEMLLKYGAEVNAKNKTSDTPLLLATSFDTYQSAKGLFETIELLLNKGAEVNTRNKNGLTPLHIMTKQSWSPSPEQKNRYRNIIDLLRQYGGKK